MRQDFHKVDIIKWLDPSQKSQIIEFFIADPSEMLKSDAKRRLHHLLELLEKSGQELLLEKLEAKLPELIERFEDIFIFQNVPFLAWPRSLIDVCAPILIKDPRRAAAIINHIDDETPLPQALCYTFAYSDKTNTKDLSHVLIHLNDAACTAMIDALNEIDYSPLLVTTHMFIITKTLMQAGRNDLFSNRTLKETCLFIIENAIDGIIADWKDDKNKASSDDIEHDFNYLFYSSFWLNSSQYNDIVLTPLAKESILTKIVRTSLLSLAKLLSLSHLTESSHKIILSSLQNELPELLNIPVESFKSKQNGKNFDGEHLLEILNLIYVKAMFRNMPNITDPTYTRPSLLNNIVITNKIMLDNLLSYLDEPDRRIVLELLKDQLPQLLAPSQFTHSSNHGINEHNSASSSSSSVSSPGPSAFFSPPPESRKRKRVEEGVTENSDFESSPKRSEKEEMTM